MTQSPNRTQNLVIKKFFSNCNLTFVFAFEYIQFFYVSAYHAYNSSVQNSSPCRTVLPWSRSFDDTYNDPNSLDGIRDPIYGASLRFRDTTVD